MYSAPIIMLDSSDFNITMPFLYNKKKMQSQNVVG